MSYDTPPPPWGPEPDEEPTPIELSYETHTSESVDKVMEIASQQFNKVASGHKWRFTSVYVEPIVYTGQTARIWRVQVYASYTI